MPATIVIACPHCGTRYQVPPETIGSGREVSCAHCGRTWDAKPPKPTKEPKEPKPAPLPRPTQEDKADRLFEKEEEAALDEAFSSEEKSQLADIPSALRNLLPKGEMPPPEVMRTIAQIKAAITPKVKQAEKAADGDAAPADPEADAELAAAQGRFQRRQRQVVRNLPAAKLRRTARITALSTLASSLALGFLLRTDIVRSVPDLAGVYGALGVKVNVVGLDFSDLETLRSRHSSGESLSVSANIMSVETHTVPVPPVVVSLFDADGHSLYQWSVTPRVGELEPGEVIGFSAELANPPKAATRATLSFADGRRVDPAPDTNSKPEEPAHNG